MEDIASPSNEQDEECLNLARAAFANTLDRVQVYFRHHQQLDDIRLKLLEELSTESKQAENKELTTTERLKHVMRVQRKLHFFRNLETASKAPIYGIAKTIFSMSKKRTMPKVEEVIKEKPLKGKLNSSTAFKDGGIRKPEREQKPTITPKPSLNASSSSLNSISKQQQGDDAPLASSSTTPRIRRIGIRRRQSSFSIRVENSRASVENDDEKDTKTLKDKNDDPPESNSPTTPVSNEPPTDKVTRKRAAAMVAVAANADIITPRVSSPRKKANNNSNSHAATPMEDEPTYCICKQVSFGDMICCDNNKCSIEWFHFGCVNIKVKPTKGKKWFCPECRHGDKQTVIKPSLIKK